MTLSLAFIAPDIIEAVANGTLPRDIGLRRQIRPSETRSVAKSPRNFGRSSMIERVIAFAASDLESVGCEPVSA